MSIQSEKTEIIEWVINLSDYSVIEQIKKLKRSYLTQNKNAQRLSLAEKESIQRGLIDIENGKITGHLDVRKLYEKWL